MGCGASSTSTQRNLSKDDIERMLKGTRNHGGLNIAGCGLVELPSEVVDTSVTSRMKVVDISGNMLERIPNDFVQAPKMTRLNASANRLEALPLTIATTAPKLELLDLHSNELLRVIPRQLPPMLRELDVSGCPLAEIPAGILQLSKLRQLSANRCGLCELPAQLSSLGKLEQLQLDDNRIRSLAPVRNWKGLGSLQILSLRSNEIGRSTGSGADAAGAGTAEDGGDAFSSTRQVVALKAALPSGLFLDTSLHLLRLDNNGLRPGQLLDLEGFDAFLARRKQRIDKTIGAGGTAEAEAICGVQ